MKTKYTDAEILHILYQGKDPILEQQKSLEGMKQYAEELDLDYKKGWAGIKQVEAAWASYQVTKQIFDSNRTSALDV